ncbi:MAG: VWA domain-containing protein [Phycisphaerae bacterium]|nr:VWA domain-containing protein [Phycisphaerae bacterium]
MNNICNKCNTENTLKSIYCRYCGVPLSATINCQKTVVFQNNKPVSNFSDEQINNRINEITEQLDPQMTKIDFSGFSTDKNQRESIIIAIDVSGSMDLEYDCNLTKIQAACRAAITLIMEKARIDSNDEVGLVTFNHQANCIFPPAPLETNKQDLIKTIQNLYSDGGTDQGLALQCAGNTFNWNRPGVVRRIELLTDGDGGNPIPVADKLKKNGVIIDVIGVGDDPSNVNEAELKEVASIIEGQRRYRFIKDSQNLMHTFTQLAGKTSTF